MQKQALADSIHYRNEDRNNTLKIQLYIILD
jgi:hypothetical protein